MENKKKSFVVKALFVTFLIILLAIEVLHAILKFDDNLYLMLSRFAGGGACLAFMIEFSFTRVLCPIGNKKPLLWLLALPGLVIAVNNFPFISFFWGSCNVNFDIGSILFFALVCLGVGFFEEMAFRGCAFMLILKGRTQSRGAIFLSIVISSAVFGLVHFINVFFGASPIAVLLQIGYSALIGALCSMVLLLTRNIWLCVILHASYNFCGGLIDNCGVGVQWIPAQMIFTAVVAIAVAVYFIVVFLKMPTRLSVELFENDVPQSGLDVASGEND